MELVELPDPAPAAGQALDTGKLRLTVQVVPLDQAREALAEVADRHTRGKIVLRIGQ